MIFMVPISAISKQYPKKFVHALAGGQIQGQSTQCIGITFGHQLVHSFS
jgi:hypothetical protein